MKEELVLKDMRIAKQYLEDMLEMSGRIQNVLNNSQNAFVDGHYRYAVERYYEIMGEAAKNVPTRIKDKYNAIPWKKIIGMRNIIIHRYREVEQKDLILTAHYALPDLIKNIKMIIEEEFKND